MITLENALIISNAKISTLHEDFRPKVEKWFDECHEKSILVYVYEGFRTPQRQDQLYAQGRTSPGRIVTNARSGQSFHNAGIAIDWVPLRRADKAEGMYEADWTNEEAYAIGQEIGYKHDLRALSWELPHLEWSKFSHWSEIPKDWFKAKS